MHHSRRAVWSVLAVVVLVAALAIGVTVAMRSGDGASEKDSATDPAGDPNSEESPPPPPECPPPPEEGERDPIDELDPRAPDTVPSGATSVRLCQGPGTELADAGALLTEDVARVVTAVNDLAQRAEKPEMCTMDIGPGYRMVFGYPDGSTFTVSGKTYGCRELVVGSAYRIPADEPLEVFRESAGQS